MIILFSTIAIVFWVSGYLVAKGITSINEKSPYWIKPLKVPKWLYYLCGAPKSKSLSNSSIIARAFAFQVMGISIGIFAVIDGIWQLSYTHFAIGLFICAALPYILVHYFSTATK